MKVYDPAERIVYVHLASPAPQHWPAARVEDGTLDRLPAGYANQSPRTRVRRDPGPSGSSVALEVAGAQGGDRVLDVTGETLLGTAVRPA